MIGTKIQWCDDTLNTIRVCDQVTWLLLTKRPELWFLRLAEVGNATRQPLNRFAHEWATGFNVPKHVKVGVSVENQEYADWRIPKLLGIPASGRFLSIEPLLGPVEIPWKALTDECDQCGRDMAVHINGCFNPHTGDDDCDGSRVVRPKIDWVIIGGESGPNARPCNVEWIRSLVGQCRDAGVPAFVKQLGAHCVSDEATPDAWPPGTRLHMFTRSLSRVLLRDPKGGEPDEWPEDLRVRQWPKWRSA